MGRHVGRMQTIKHCLHKFRVNKNEIPNADNGNGILCIGSIWLPSHFIVIYRFEYSKSISSIYAHLDLHTIANMCACFERLNLARITLEL